MAQRRPLRAFGDAPAAIISNHDDLDPSASGIGGRGGGRGGGDGLMAAVARLRLGTGEGGASPAIPSTAAPCAAPPAPIRAPPPAAVAAESAPGLRTAGAMAVASTKPLAEGSPSTSVDPVPPPPPPQVAATFTDPALGWCVRLVPPGGVLAEMGQLQALAATNPDSAARLHRCVNKNR